MAKMNNSLLVFVIINLTLLLMCLQTVDCYSTKGTGACPIKETVKQCLPKCLSDWDCVGDRRCCKNSCGTNSCARVSPVNTGHEPNSQSSVVTCANEKCLPGQRCKSDNALKKPKCSW